MAIGLGIIGLGVVGRRTMGQALADPKFRVAAGWDLSADARAQALAEYPDLSVAGDAQGVFGDPEVDLVYIATPPASHRDYALAAFDAGKAIFCEKPLSVDLAQGREMVMRAAESKRPSAVNFVHASSVGGEKIRAAVAEGRLGELRGVDIRLHFARWPREWQAAASNWLSFREQGGYTREVLSHFLYLTERIFGSVKLEGASVAYPPETRLAETHVVARLSCGNLPVTVAASSGGVGLDEIEFTVWGDRLSYRLTDWHVLWESDGGGWQAVASDVADVRAEGFRRQLGQLADMMEGRGHTLADFAVAYAVQETVESILGS